MKTETQLQSEQIILSALKILMDGKYIQHKTLKRVLDEIEQGYDFKEEVKPVIQKRKTNMQFSGVNLQ